MERRFYACYLLCSFSSPKHTYIGFTVNPARRIRQHNGEITCGAFRTKRRRPWQMVLCVYGFTTQRRALKFEWAWQHPKKTRYLRRAREKDQLKGVTGDASGNIKIAYKLLSARKWRRQKLTVHFFSTKFLSLKKGCLPLPEQMELEVGSMDQLPDSAFSYEDEDREQAASDLDASESSSSDDSCSSESELSSSDLSGNSDTETSGDERVEPVKAGRAKKPSSNKRKQKKLKSDDAPRENPRKRVPGKKARQDSTGIQNPSKKTARSKARNSKKRSESAGSSGVETSGLEQVMQSKESSSDVPSVEGPIFTPQADTRFVEPQQKLPVNHGPGTDAELVSSSLLRTPNPVKPSLAQKQSPYLILSSSPQPSLFPSISFLTPCQRFPAIPEAEKPTPMSIILISSTPAPEVIDIADSPVQ